MAEDPKERVDRELKELIEEIRVILPGVQILGAFLATAAFSTRFKELSDLDRHTYFVAFATALVSAVFLIAPTAQHRLRWRQSDKGDMVEAAHRLTIVGLAFAAFSLGASSFLVADVVYDATVATLVTAAIAVAVAVTWCIAPLLARHHESPQSVEPGRRAA